MADGLSGELIGFFYVCRVSSRKCGGIMFQVFCLYLHFLYCSKYCSTMKEGEAGSGNSEIGQVFYFTLSEKQGRLVSKG